MIRAQRLALFTLVVLVGGLPLDRGQEARDCCGVTDCTVCEHLDNLADMPRLAEHSHQLFVGLVVRAELVSCCDRFADVTFRVKKVWTPATRPIITIRTAGPFPFAIGHEYLVSAMSYGQNEYPSVDCSFRPLELSAARRHIFALDEWQRAKGKAQSRE